MAKKGKLRAEPSEQKNYGPTAEKRVDRGLRSLAVKGIIHFWFRADKKLDAEGVDHIFGSQHHRFSVWVVQVTSGKKKRRTYYRRLSRVEFSVVKKPYYRRRYYRYIPLLAVTEKTRDEQIEMKLFGISRKYKSIFENKNCPPHLKMFLVDFLTLRGISVPRVIAENTS